MSGENTEYMISVMQAHLDGAKIERSRPVQCDGGEYVLESEPRWSWSTTHYRVKPEPREFWLDMEESSFIEVGKGSRYWGEEHELIKVREVL